MKGRMLLAVLLSLAMAGRAGAQCEPGNAKWPGCFIDQFPSLRQLQVSLREDVQSRPTADVLSDSGSVAWATGPQSGRLASAKALTLDNLKFHVDGTYTKTLERDLASDGQTLAPFKLTGVKLIPTLSLTYELNLGQLTKTHHPWIAAHELQEQKDARYRTEVQKLQASYVQFEELRAEFLEAQRKQDGVSAAFYKLKAQAVDALSTARFSGRILDQWLAAEYSRAPQPTTASLQASSGAR